MFKSIGSPESCNKIIELVKLSDPVFCQLNQGSLFLFKLYLGYAHICLQIYLFPRNSNYPLMQMQGNMLTLFCHRITFKKE